MFPHLETVTQSCQPCILVFTDRKSFANDLFCSFPLKHLAWAAVRRQSAGPDGPLVCSSVAFLTSKPDVCVPLVPLRAHLPSAGSFYCSETGLGFDVSAAVTMEYEYGSWAESLSPSARRHWMIAGPLFHIRAEPGPVRAVHLPHFMCLAGDFSPCRIAHFEAGQMTLETPMKISVFHVALANPSFSQLGVLWRKIRSAAKFIPIHSLVLIYRAFNAADITLHLYLIPNDHSLNLWLGSQMWLF
uniref:FIIND domain-containing protein n=1 Tax=Pelusios castaneus TaxID=367368 RepID=A0A8C8S022_9SAUR